MYFKCKQVPKSYFHVKMFPLLLKTQVDLEVQQAALTVEGGEDRMRDPYFFFP